MTREETIKVLSVIKVAFPNAYRDIKKQEAENTILLWQESFKNEDGSDVMRIVKGWINGSKFPPVIADIKNELLEKVSDINWNSSYWFENDREVYDGENILYYDVTKGIDVPLLPYKGWRGEINE